MNRAFLLVPVLACLGVSSCAGDDASEADGASPGTAIETRSLSVHESEADLDEISDYRLTMGAVRRWYEAQREVYEAIRANPDLAARIRIDEDEPSLDDLERHLDGIPEVRRAARRVGMDTREFGVITWSLVQSSVALGSIEMGSDPDEVMEQTGVLRSNIEFVRENREEIEQMRAELEAMEPESADEDEEYEDWE